MKKINHTLRNAAFLALTLVIGSFESQAMIPSKTPSIAPSLNQIQIQSLNANAKTGEGLKFERQKKQLQITMTTLRHGKLKEVAYKIPLSYEKDILEAIDGKKGLKILSSAKGRSNSQCFRKPKWKLTLNGQTRLICKDREVERVLSILYKAGAMHADLTLDPAIASKPTYSIYE